MSVIGWYCKAYEQDRFEAYTNWAEAKSKYEAAHGAISESDILFLHEDLVLTVGAVREENIVLDEITDSWRDFCYAELGFSIPDYMHEAQPAATVASSSE